MVFLRFILVVIVLFSLLSNQLKAQNNALNFDGSNDNIQIPHNNAFNLTANYTIEAWIKLNAANISGINTIVSKGHGNGVGVDDETYMFNVTNGKLNMYMYQGASSYWMEGNATIPANTWTHVACTFDGSAQLLKFYINGVLDKTIGTINQVPAINTQPLIIGRQGYNGGCQCNHLNGEMDEFRMWNRTLCEDEIMNNMGCELPISTTNLILNYHFNQGTGGGNNLGATNISDQSGYGYDGTLYNFGLNGITSNWVTSGASVSGTCSPIRDINLVGNLNNIPDGSTTISQLNGTTLGTVVYMGGTNTQTYTIENTGGSPLTVTGVNITGPDAAMFVAGPITPAGPIPPGGSATFQVVYTASSIAVNSATVTVESDDCDESSYDFQIEGRGADFGAALSFDGTSDYVDIGDVDLTGSFTLEAWVKTSTTGMYCILAKGDGGGLDENYIFEIVNGKIGLYLNYGGAGNGSWTYSNSTIPNNTWCHVAVSYNNTTHTNKFYLNGVLDGTNVRTSATPFQNNVNTYIGRQGNVCQCNPFAGEMDEVRIWNKALTECEIQAYRNCEIIFPNANLVANYNFNAGIDGTAGATNYGLNTLMDNSGNSNTGFLFNFAYAGSTSNWVAPGGVTSGSPCTELPEIALNGLGTPIAGDSINAPVAADNTNFGNVGVGINQDNIFAIQNLSTVGLLNLLAGPTYVRIVGSSDFTVQSDASSTVNPLGASNFTIRFNPSSTGLKTAKVRIYSDDCDEPVSTFNIQGTGVAPPGNILDLDGVNDYVATPFVPSASVMKNFTLECWVKGDAAPQSGANVYTGPVYGYKLGIIWDHQNGSFAGAASVTAADGSYGTASFGPLSGNTWYHLAATYDGTTLKSYKNGVLQNSAVTTGGIADDFNVLNLGTHPNTALGFPHNFAGQIDEVRVWSRALSAAEIATNMNCELTGPQECIELYYRFNQGLADDNNTSITTVTDLSGKFRDASLVNFGLTTTGSNFSAANTTVGSCAPVFFPEIEIKGNNTVIVNGNTSPSFADSTNFGNVDVSAGSNTNTFTISNLGTIGSTLILSGSPIVSISGSADFSLEVDAGSAALSQGSSTTFKIKFNPSTMGLQTATVTIQNNDCDEGPFTFTIYGYGTSPGASLSSSGTSEYIALANSTDFNFTETSKFSLEFMIAYNSAQQDVIFSKLTNLAPYNGYEASIQNGRINFFMCSNFSTNNYLNVTTVDPFNNGAWHHVAIVYPGIADASLVKIYVDGVNQPLTIGQNTLTGTISNANTAHLAARGNSGQSLFYTGLMDELRVWNYALCEAEINSFMNCEKTGTETGLVACYHFNQGFQGADNSAVTTLLDAAGGNNNGILSNFTLSGFASDWNSSGGVITGTSCGPLLQSEIDIFGASTNIVNGDLTPSTLDNTHFGNVVIGSSKALNYRIYNNGNATLNFKNTPAVTITGSSDFSVTLQPAFSFIGNGSSVIVSIKFVPSSQGLQTAVVSVLSDDCDESNFTFTISGSGVVPPEINVKQNTTSILDGGSFDFGNKVVNSNPGSVSFTVENLSTGGKLALDGAPQKVLLTGANAASFQVNSSSLPDSINTSSSASFSIQFNPLSSGTKSAQIIISNNDPDETTYTITLTGNGVVAGDLDSNGTIDAGEIAGDTSGNGTIEYPSEITGDINGNGSIGTGEVSGDNNGDGIINNGEIAGNTNGTGGIDNGEIAGDISGNGVIDGKEFAGDADGDGILDPTELLGDINGDGTIAPPEIAGDINGDGIADPDPAYVLVGKGTIVSNYISRYSVQPELPAVSLPAYYSYAWVYSDTTLYMIKDTTRYFMDVVANNNTNNGILSCIIYRFGLPYDTLEFPITVNKNYINIAELAELSAECAQVANPTNDCQESFIDYFKLNTINYDGNGCVRGGFQDLTASGYTTDLEMGFTYTVELKPNKLLFFPNPQDPSKNDTTIIFYAVWIDYNNDGDFEDFAEYVKNGDSKSASAKLINITIANNELYEGSRRMRVGMKTGSGFSSSDACGINAIGSSGEIEDYLVTLVPMGALQAPNFLSPNNDGENDLFSIKGVDVQKTRVLTVMNKAGAVVYQEEGYGDKELWSGKDKNGELLPKGTYYYIFKNGSSEVKSFLEIDY